MRDTAYCTGFSASIIGTDGRTKLVYRPRCRQWSCAYCAQKNMATWRWRVANEIADHANENGIVQNTWFFWTLTLLGYMHDKSMSPEENTVNSLQKWRETWDTLMKRIRRMVKPYTQKMVYMRVFESHKDGTLHVHMITNVAPNDIAPRDDNPDVWNSAELQAHLDELELGYIHDIKPVVTDVNLHENGVSRNVSAYVTKYLTKEAQGTIRQCLKDAGMGRIRVIQTSSKFWDKPDVDGADIDWAIGRIDRMDYHTDSKIDSYVDISRDIKIRDSDFGDHFSYPNKTSDMLWIDEINDATEGK